MDGDRIAVGARLTAGQVLLWVADSGTGIKAEEADRIFERFVRGP